MLARVVAVVAILAATFGPTSAAWAQDQHQGLQAGWAIDDKGNVNFTSSFSLQNRFMHEAEASWIRLNFRLGACYQDWVTRGCNGRTALETYDEVVDIALNNGFQILGLIGHEAWPGRQVDWNARNAEHTSGDGDNAYLRDVSDHAVMVLATHFKDRITTWEIWNEPNTWTEQDADGLPVGGSFIYPSGFAWMLTHAYEAIKLVQPNAVIVSGGLFGHDLGDPALLFARDICPTGVASGADYLCATYEMGLRHAGWQPGRYPFNRIGQHIYIDGGGPTSEEKMRFYLEDVRDAYLRYEGPDTSKTTDITEFGWSTAGMSQETQADNLLIAYDTFRQVGYVGRAYWFHAQDVPEANLFYGLTDSSGKKKRAFEVYQDAAAYDVPEADNAPRPAPPARAPAQTPRADRPGADRPIIEQRSADQPGLDQSADARSTASHSGAARPSAVQPNDGRQDADQPNAARPNPDPPAVGRTVAAVAPQTIGETIVTELP